MLFGYFEGVGGVGEVDYNINAKESLLVQKKYAISNPSFLLLA